LVPLIECLAEVLHAAHACKMVHRDVKPANVMVMEHGIRLVPKLIDFGIAKMSRDLESPTPETWPEGSLGENQDPFGRHGPDGAVTGTDPTLKHRHLTPVGAGIGSWWYMAPEQWGDARAAGPASDIYSLGVLAYKALTGRVPFPGESEHQCYQQHRYASVPPLGGDFSPDLDRVFQRALAKDPNARHGSALELAAELRTALTASEHELLRSLAQQWNACARRPDLLLGGDTLAGVERWTRQAPPGALSKLECSYVAASQRRARRSARLRRLLFASAVAIALGVVAAWSVLRTRMAEGFVTQAEVDRGQQALIHGESSEAVLHLEKAYQRGERSPGVAFMLARALQPRMSELARFTSSSGRMWSATFASDGKRVLTTDDKSAQMWDAESGQLLFVMSHDDTVYGAVFSPDNSRVITAGGDGTVRIWKAATGAPIRELKYQGSSATKWSYYAVAMSSHLVAAVDVTGKAVHVWDAETGTQVAELANDGAEMQLLAFSADGHWLATSGLDEVRVFDTSTWGGAATITGPRVRSLSFDPTRPRLAVGTGDGLASIWEIPSGVLVRRLRGGGASVDAIAFSRDGVLVATASRDGTEQVWDAASGGLRTQLNSHHDMIYAVEFSATGALWLSAGADGAVVVSNVATGIPIARLEGPKGRVIAAHFDLESRRVVGASWDGTARVWDATSPYRRWGSPQIGAECDAVAALVPDQRFIALSCRDHGTHVWDTARGELLAELPSVSGVEGDYFSALPALTAAGDRAAIARGNTVEIYALPSGQLLHTIAHPAAVNAVAFAPAGHDLVSGSVDGSLLLTRGDGDPIELPRSLAGIDAVAILTDGRVVAADAGNRLRVIGPDSHALLMDLIAPSRIRLLRASPDGRRLITISARSAQSPLVLWALDQRRLLARLDGHVGRVFAARFVD
ncbi:MAG: hypothetical protein ABIY55_17960, partial [Kofleriaceae bacterium]